MELETLSAKENPKGAKGHWTVGTGMTNYLNHIPSAPKSSFRRKKDTLSRPTEGDSSIRVPLCAGFKSTPDLTDPSTLPLSGKHLSIVRKLPKRSSP
jgi:hypothetical protein